MNKTYFNNKPDSIFQAAYDVLTENKKSYKPFKIGGIRLNKWQRGYLGDLLNMTSKELKIKLDQEEADRIAARQEYEKLEKFYLKQGKPERGETEEEKQAWEDLRNQYLSLGFGVEATDTAYNLILKQEIIDAKYAEKEKRRESETK